MIIEGQRNVVEALYFRLDYIFNSQKKDIHFSFSGGKESLIIAVALEDLLKAGKIDPKRLEVSFIDEEAIYPCLEEVCLDWKRRFEALGVVFKWFCIDFAHFNCLESLKDEESWILWERGKENQWVRPMPAFAIKSDYRANIKASGIVPTYQDFMKKVNKNRIDIIGIRANESMQRRHIFINVRFPLIQGRFYPIFDWHLNDVWLFHRDRNTVLPAAYLYMWKEGTPANRLRISQFFSIDTVASLVKMAKYYPGLMQRIMKRSENAELALLYYDSKMFMKMSPVRKKIEKEKNAKIDWREEFLKKCRSPQKKNGKMDIKYLKHLYLSDGHLMNQEDFRNMVEIIEAGDPKGRTYRSLHHNVKGRKHG